jgi:hypothetical protein
MEIPALSLFRHIFGGCPCGHAEHIGRGIRDMSRAACPECDAIAGDGMTLTVIPVEAAERFALSPGDAVRYCSRTMAVVEIEQITKLDGRLPTPFVRLLLTGTEQGSAT